MIHQLTLENFRGLSETFVLFDETVLIGRNGAHKSSLKEAIAFLFTGQDSSGNRAPVHLISWGEEGCKVEVKTSKAVISRSLSRQKNSTLKIIRGETSTTLTQTKLEEMMRCSSDLFLSIFNCGYFMALEGHKQRAVLAEILPKIDRYALWEKISGITLTAEERAKFDLSRRIDLVVTAVGSARRELQRSFNENSGQLAAYSNVSQMPAPPTLSGAREEAHRLASLRQSWQRFETQMNSYQQALRHNEQLAALNQQAAERRAVIENALKGLELHTVAIPEPPTHLHEKWKQLHQEMKTLPPPPPLQGEVDFDNCATCGQTVGQKHREKVRAANQKLLVEHDRLCADIVAHNTRIKQELDAVEQERRQAMAEIEDLKGVANNIKVREAQLRAELKGCIEQPLLPLPEKPLPPTEAYDEAKERQTVEAMRADERRVGEYEHARRQYEQATRETARLVDLNTSLDAAIGRLRQLEDALRTLPEEEFRMQNEALRIDGYKIELGDRVELSDMRGCPFNLLSTGEKVKASLALSRKFNQMLPRPVGVIFIDDADLVDNIPLGEDAQFIIAHVAAGKELTVKNYAEG